MKEKKISIIIPVYNVEKYICTSLDSIISHKKSLDKWLEIILVDDGSTDNSGNICDRYASKYSFIKVIHQKNQGQSVARNVALSVANGEWITFVDSDDIVRADYLSVLLANIMDNKEADIIIFKYKSFTDKDNVQNKIDKISPYSSKKVSILSKSKAMYYITTEEIGNYMWNKVFKKELFNNIKIPVGKRFEDLAVLYKYFQLANEIYLYDDILYFYRQRENSSIHVTNAKEKIALLRESIDVRTEQLKFFKEFNYLRAYKSANHYFMMEEVFYIVGINRYNLKKDDLYLDAQKYLRSYMPRTDDGIKFYLFIKLYNKIPKLIERCLKIIK
ncbi:glycosyltransferase family 2 protein [Lactobacillus kitasatonis]|uniref:Glycosyltransferase n=1 Tax=Lactobacillus kitasatonis TaxID=237446 RepID=A0ABS1LTR9_9LACO|nr:glycosyltransferase [Lactobacillus kitasatonis]MBL1071370.1 glycosyltransferase [Lactobacillus kitasatonis]